MQAPRALSVEDRHPDAARIVIRVNGIIQQFVISYDCDAGTVERYERTPDNRFVMTRDGNVSVELVMGHVTARIP